MHALDKSNFRNKLSRKQFAMCIAREALKYSYHTTIIPSFWQQILVTI